MVKFAATENGWGGVSSARPKTGGANGMKKNILAILATFACLAAEATVTVYTWYGDAGDGLWTTPSNWRKSDYPSVSGADGHCVLFDKGSGTSTTVNCK